MAATHPCQYASSTRAGTESVAQLAQPPRASRPVCVRWLPHTHASMLHQPEQALNPLPNLRSHREQAVQSAWLLLFCAATLAKRWFRTVRLSSLTSLEIGMTQRLQVFLQVNSSWDSHGPSLEGLRNWGVVGLSSPCVKSKIINQKLSSIANRSIATSLPVRLHWTVFLPTRFAWSRRSLRVGSSFLSLISNEYLLFRDAAHWVSGCLEVVEARHPEVAGDIFCGISYRASGCLFSAVRP